MNNLILIDKKDPTNILKISLLLLTLFIFVTIITFNIYKGNKIILPDLEEEFREKSHFHLFKSMGWSLLITLIFAYFTLSTNNKPVKYAVNKAVKI